MVWGCFSCGKVGGKSNLEEERPSLHPCHTLWTTLDQSQFNPTAGQRVKTQLQTIHFIYLKRKERSMQPQSLCQ